MSTKPAERPVSHLHLNALLPRTQEPGAFPLPAPKGQEAALLHPPTLASPQKLWLPSTKLQPGVPTGCSTSTLHLPKKSKVSQRPFLNNQHSRPPAISATWDGSAVDQIFDQQKRAPDRVGGGIVRSLSL